MSFSKLPRELKAELLEYVSPLSWPNAMAQFVDLAERDFARPGSKTDISGTFCLYDTERERNQNEVAERWRSHVTVLIENLKGEFTYNLKVFAVYCLDPSYPDDPDREDDPDWDPCKTDLTVDVEQSWTTREQFLEAASDLLQFLPRQITRLPKLSCSLFACKYDKQYSFVTLPGSWYEHISCFPEVRGVGSLLSQVC